VKLDSDRIAWIVKMKEQGAKNAEIASVQKVSVRRVQQLYSRYRKDHQLPVLGRAGRPSKPITGDEIRLVREAYSKYRANAWYLSKYINKTYNVRINHNRIHRIMVSEGMSSEEARKKQRRKWIRYEREHSNSLWHTDWHEIKDPRWKGKQLIVYEDDASRFVTGYGVFDNVSSQHSVDVLDAAIKKYDRPASVISDNGSPFTTNVKPLDSDKPTSFEHYMMKNKIRHIRARVRHPQSNGKLEKFFDIFEKKLKFFNSIEEFMEWYNNVRPHGALDLDEMETPLKAYYARMAPRDVLVDPEILWREGPW
jgi:putative transposase